MYFASCLRKFRHYQQSATIQCFIKKTWFKRTFANSMTKEEPAMNQASNKAKWQRTNHNSSHGCHVCYSSISEISNQWIRSYYSTGPVLLIQRGSNNEGATMFRKQSWLASYSWWLSSELHCCTGNTPQINKLRNGGSRLFDLFQNMQSFWIVFCARFFLFFFLLFWVISHPQVSWPPAIMHTNWVSDVLFLLQALLLS